MLVLAIRFTVVFRRFIFCCYAKIFTLIWKNDQHNNEIRKKPFQCIEFLRLPCNSKLKKNYKKPLFEAKKKLL